MQPLPRRLGDAVRRPGSWLVVIAVLHALAPLVLLGVHWTFGPDETVYLSQLNGSHPALYFSPPRARGSTLIGAPVTLLTSSVAAVRVWVSLLSGVALWLAFRPWLRLVPAWVVPAAAATFASLWTVTYYGFEVMPNEWVAFATLGACGAMLRWFAEHRRRHLVVMVVGLAVIGLLRPSDAGYAAAGLGLCALFAPAPVRRRAAAVGALAAGVVLGVAQWIVEAETSFGGISRRIHAAQAEQGGGGPFWSLPEQARVLAGPLLCRGGCHVDAPLKYRLWWVALAVLVVLALVGAVRRRDNAFTVVTAVVTAGVVAAQYLVTVPYGAPRFLLPVYALLAVPAVLGARELVSWAPGLPARRVLAVVLVLGFVGAAGLQLRVLTASVGPRQLHNANLTATRVRLLRAAGLRPGCRVIGLGGDVLQLTYGLRCTIGPSTRQERFRELARGRQLLWAHSRRHPAYPGTWRPVHLPGDRLPFWIGEEHRGTTAGRGA